MKALGAWLAALGCYAGAAIASAGYVAAAKPLEAAEPAAALNLPPGAWYVGHGLSFSLGYIGQAAANPRGGVRQEDAFAGQLYFGADLDLGRAGAFDGGSIHVAITNRHGDSLSEKAIGNNTSVQEIFGGGQNTRLTKLSYRQKLFGDRLDIEAGRLVANTDFLSSPFYCHFQTNSACGNPTFVFKTSNFTYWPVSSWGGRAKAWLTETIFLHGGVYEVNPLRALPEDHGLNWSTKDATGVVIPFELGYSTTFDNDPTPRNFGVGGWYDTSDYSDPVRDVLGGPAVLTGLPSLARSGRSGAYARFDQMVWRPNPDEKRGLTLFGVAMTGVSGKLTQDYFLEFGVVQKGTLSARPDDTIGFVINTQKLGSKAIRNIDLAQGSIGINRKIPEHQVMMELNYGLKAAPGVTVTPNFQYIVNPDQTRFPFRRRNIPDAFVFGVNLKADLFTLAGLAN